MVAVVSGHTAGPWSRNIAPASKDPTIFADRNTHVAQVDTRVPASECEANCALISAAPELLAALQMADEWIRTAKAEGCPLPVANTLPQIAAALAKAQP